MLSVSLNSMPRRNTPETVLRATGLVAVREVAPDADQLVNIGGRVRLAQQLS
jgi:hypothetical protein